MALPIVSIAGEGPSEAYQFQRKFQAQNKTPQTQF
jgi:hypothetical protein